MACPQRAFMIKRPESKKALRAYREEPFSVLADCAEQQTVETYTVPMFQEFM